MQHILHFKHKMAQTVTPFKQSSPFSVAPWVL